MWWNKRVENVFILLIAVKVGLIGFFFFTDRLDNLGSLARAFAQQQETVQQSEPERAKNPAANPTRSQRTTKKSAAPSATGIDMEIIQANEQRMKELDRKEEELKRREDRLQTLEQDLEQKIAELQRIQNRIDQQVELRKDLTEQGIVKLAKVYEAMPAEEAATLIETIDRDVAVLVLSKMRGRQAGKVLASVDPEIASRISELIVKKR